MSKSALSAVRPASTEYAPYFEQYIGRVPEGDIVTTLRQQAATTLALVRGIPEPQGSSRYAPDKWSIKELVGHVIDSERIFAYRALRFARNDQSELPGFEQDDYVRNATFNDLSLSDLADEFEVVRKASLYLFNSLPEEAWLRTGKANGVEVSVRAIAYITAGHELHHMGILKTKYLA